MTIEDVEEGRERNRLRLITELCWPFPSPSIANCTIIPCRYNMLSHSVFTCIFFRWNALEWDFKWPNCIQASPYNKRIPHHKLLTTPIPSNPSLKYHKQHLVLISTEEAQLQAKWPSCKFINYIILLNWEWAKHRPKQLSSGKQIT